MPLLFRALAPGMAVVMAATAHAQTSEPAPTAATDLILYGDVRLVAANGEQGWLDGGFGKGRIGNSNTDGGLRVRPYLAEAGLVYQPHFTWSLGGTIAVIAQNGQEQPFGLSEAFLTYRPLPVGDTRLSVRAGLMWPALSLEHSGPEWAVTNTITPSAINSWIGEEVKVTGLELNATRMFGAHRITLTAAVFGGDDTAGTLLTFRGWALHDVKATAFSHLPLPPMNAFMRNAQAPTTRSVIELDGTPGFYTKVSWAPPGPFEVQYFHYDNMADPQKVNATRQWGWRTRFDHIGAILDLGERTRLIGQALTGTTVMGFPRNGPERWVDMRYRSAFVMATRKIDAIAVSARIEAFDTRNHGSVVLPFDDETGWSADAAVRWPLASFATLLGEALYIDSRRDSRARVGEDARQHQTILQLSLHLRAAR